jgi:adenylate cyclase
MVRLVLKRRASTKNPNYCDVCETFVRTHPGGAEVEISMLFADVRGSTTLAEQMRPTEFSRLMNRFFDCANRVVIDSDGLVDKLVGDEVVALYVPAVGPDHARKAVDAAGRPTARDGRPCSCRVRRPHRPRIRRRGRL